MVLRNVRLAVDLITTSFVAPKNPHLAYCFKVLPQVSRSFAMVIQLLKGNLRDAMCVFYLVLRALDTIEDDMSIALEEKNPLLENFYIHFKNPSWRFVCGSQTWERDLMENFFHVSLAFSQLSQDYQEIISQITKEMGMGMAEFTCREVQTVSDYDKYCYYVAGLVGVGSSSLFNKSGRECLEEKVIRKPDTGAEARCISMGRCLQKVNIIKDYLEDITAIPSPRMFWPPEIWKNYAPLLKSFKEPECEKQAVQCLNHMITDWLRHLPDCLEYIAELHDPSVFRFCAVPQVMAVATATLCYNNPNLFKGPLKISRATTYRITSKIHDIDDVCSSVNEYALVLAAKVEKEDPNSVLTMERVKAVLEACTKFKRGKKGSSVCGKKVIQLMMAATILISIYLFLHKYFF